MQVRKDKMKRPMAGIGVFEKGGDLRVQLTSLNLGLNLRAVRGGSAGGKPSADGNRELDLG